MMNDLIMNGEMGMNKYQKVVFSNATKKSLNIVFQKKIFLFKPGRFSLRDFSGIL
jgi:hypothetical protein